MKKTKIILRAGEQDYTVTINLLSNSYVEHMIKNHDTSGLWSEHTITIPSRMPYNFDEVNSLWKDILNCYNNFLSIIEHEDLVSPPEVFDMSNKYTNILHRVFTTYSWHETYFGNRVKYTQEGRDIVEDMNIYIHELEKYIENKTRNSFEPVTWMDIQGEIGAHNRYFFSDEELENISTEHSVFCVKHILGKDHLIAYLDEDEPNHWDVQTSWISYCGFCIDLKGDIKRAWKDPNFNKWLKGSKIGYYPVGDMSQEDMDILSHLQENYKNNIEVITVVYE